MASNPPDKTGRSLEMLYSIVASINIIDDQEKMCLRVLGILKDWMGARAISYCRCGDDNVLELVASIGFEDSIHQTRVIGEQKRCPCRTAMANGHVADSLATKTCCGKDVNVTNSEDPLRFVCVPVQTRNRILGVINMWVSTEDLASKEDWRVLLTSVGQNLGLAVQRSEFEENSERLSRIEERTYLAHELHDSLAQTLASIRYHLRILDNAYQLGEDSKVSNMLEVVENSVEEANKELRELINRFRLPLQPVSLIPAIESVVQRFKDDTGIKTKLQNSVKDINFPAQDELQIVRIIQEALTNIRKHTKPKTVRVMLSQDEENLFHVLVEDDGTGFDIRKMKSIQGEHIGLSVMSERAERIGGKLAIESAKLEGTRVHLTFPDPMTSQ